MVRVGPRHLLHSSGAAEPQDHRQRSPYLPSPRRHLHHTPTHLFTDQGGLVLPVGRKHAVTMPQKTEQVMARCAYTQLGLLKVTPTC